MTNEASPRFGLVPRAEAVALSGLELLTRMLQGALPQAPFAELLEIELVAVEAGKVTFTGTPSDRFLNPYGSIHAGWTTALLDSAMSCAVQTLLRPGQVQSTVELKVNCVRPVLPRTGVIRAEGTVIHQGRQICTADARASDPQGKLLAHAVSTCMIVDAATA